MENKVGSSGTRQFSGIGHEFRESGAVTTAVESGKPAESSAPVTLETPAEKAEAARSNSQAMLGELGFDGQMRQLEFREILRPGNNSTPATLFSGSTVQAQASPAQPTAAMVLAALPAKLDAANIPPKLRDEVMALAKNKPGIDVRILVKNAENALKSSDPVDAMKSLVLRTRTDDFFESFNSKYMINGVEVEATPHFRMTAGWSGPKGRTSSVNIQDDLNILIAKKDKAHYNPAMKRAIHGVAYGRATPEQVKMVTESLIRSGEFEKAQKNHPGLSDSETIRMMQWDNGVGIDCAGYVQQAFLAVHGGGRANYGFREFENEDLMSLKGNKHFAQVKPQDVKPGDLIALDKPPGDSVGHTVLVRDRHVMTPAEMSKYQDPDGFAKAGDKVHVYEVDASFGGGYIGDRGGLVRKVWMYNERTGQWAEPVPDETGTEKLQKSTMNGPYNHPMNGIYRPKGK